MLSPTMLPAWQLGVLAAAAFLLSRNVISFLGHNRAARKMGVPVVYSPVSARNRLWLAFAGVLGPLIRKAPFGLGDWVHYTRFMWIWDDKDRMHQKLGKVFAQVSPGGLVVSVPFSANVLSAVSSR